MYVKERKKFETFLCFPFLFPCQEALLERLGKNAVAFAMGE